MRVSLVPLHAGNLGSLTASLKRLGHEVDVWEYASHIRSTDWVVFPGVGAMGEVHSGLTQRGLMGALAELHQAGQPILGICLGMQLLFHDADEGGRGLGWIDGSVPRLSAAVLPHMGWNELQPADGAPRWLLRYSDACLYFVHSFFVLPSDPRTIAATTHYGHLFPSMVIDGSLHGVQFHPELSGDVGQALLEDILTHAG